MIRMRKGPEEEKKAGAEEVTDAAAGAAAPAAARGRGARIFGIARGRRAAEAPSAAKAPTSAGELRVQKDLQDLDGGSVAKVEFPDPDNLTEFFVTIRPDSGYWKGAAYRFRFRIPRVYPHEAPKVHCETKIYHPNIDLDGNVCLNILREDWKPVLDLNAVIYGLIYLFYEPNPDDPLNHEAADVFRRDQPRFSNNVRMSLAGRSLTIGGKTEAFDRLL